MDRSRYRRILDSYSHPVVHGDRGVVGTTGYVPIDTA